MKPISIRRALEKAARFGDTREEKTQLDRVLATGVPKLDFGGALQDYPVNLANLPTSGDGLPVPGHAIYYRRENSHPGGRITVRLGTELRELYPGASMGGPFDRAYLFRSARSVATGTARLVIATGPQAWFREPAEVTGAPMDPVDLLGDSTVPTFVAVAEDTQPSGATPTGSFIATGFRKLRVLVDGQAANTLTSTDLIPWTREPNSAVWYEQGQARIGIPDSAATAYRYREFFVDVLGNGLMFFEIRNLLPAPATQLGFIVQGLA